MIERAAEGSGEPRGAELLRARLRGVERRLHLAKYESEEQGFSRVGSVIADCCYDVTEMLRVKPLPPTRVVEALIARAEKALDVWVCLTAF